MRNIKMLFTVLLLLFVIAGCALLPDMFSQWKDKRSLGMVTTASIDSLPQIKQNDLSVVEKLQMISRFEVQDGTVSVSSQKNAENTALTADSITAVCKRELSNLQKLGILPSWDSEKEFYSYHHQVLTYIDAQNPENYVLLWEVNLSGENMHFNLTLDDETGKIYQFYCWAEERLDAPPFSEAMEQWGEYLGLKNEYPKDKGSGTYRIAVDAAVSDEGIALYEKREEDAGNVNPILFHFIRDENSYQIAFLAESTDSVAKQYSK